LLDFTKNLNLSKQTAVFLYHPETENSCVFVDT
jgi:hypothetical protein